MQEYDIETAADIQDALKDLLFGTLKELMETEMDDRLGYDRYERSDKKNYRNGTKQKRVRSKYGEFEVDVPQDRNSSFDSKVLPKRQKDVSAIDDKIISMYAKGMTTQQISETIEDIYGFEVSEGMVSNITDRLLPQIEEWQNRPLASLYLIVFIDAVHFSVSDEGVIKKLAAYVVLGINEDGKKEVLTIVVGKNESSKYWLSVLNSLKNRGVQDILILCSDGLTGIKDAVSPIFKFSKDVRTAFYTTNAIESLNASYRRLNRHRSVFTSSQALLKALYLATFEATKKMDYADQELGKSTRRINNYVSGQDAGIEKSYEKSA